tara:strand:- start:4262 stop:5137 length:876 start_codon:yes stop_codon:yes gene_type:complete
MAFFKLFPKVPYDLRNDGVLQNIVNIYRSVRPLQNFVDNVSAYKFYEVKNGERPDIVSERLYGTPDYYWTFFILNEFLHDGLASWPLSQENLQDYMVTEYNGYAIQVAKPIIRRNSDLLITDHENSLSGRFNIGEVITGNISGSKGTLTKKIVDLNQLIVQDVTLGTSGIHPHTGVSDSSILGGAFIGSKGVGDVPSENVTGFTTSDTVGTWAVYKYIDAPYYFYDETDPEKRVADNARMIDGATPDSNLNYVSNRAHLENTNDSRAKIRVISPSYITQFVDMFETVINSE